MTQTPQTFPRVVDHRKRMSWRGWVDLLLHIEAIWRCWRYDRFALLTRCLRLEAALHRAQCDRDYWFEIARTLAHKFGQEPSP